MQERLSSRHHSQLFVCVQCTHLMELLYLYDSSIVLLCPVAFNVDIHLNRMIIMMAKRNAKQTKFTEKQRTKSKRCECLNKILLQWLTHRFYLIFTCLHSVLWDFVYLFCYFVYNLFYLFSMKHRCSRYRFIFSLFSTYFRELHLNYWNNNAAFSKMVINGTNALSSV